MAGRIRNIHYSPAAAGQLLLLCNLLAMALAPFHPTWHLAVMTGAMFMFCGVTLWVMATVIMKKHGHVPSGLSYMSCTQVITRGIFGVVRHPQYLGFIFFNVGILLMTQHLVMVFTTLGSSLLIITGMLEEEQQLIERFGRTYKRYMHRVPRMNLLTGLARQIMRRHRKRR